MVKGKRAVKVLFTFLLFYLFTFKKTRIYGKRKQTSQLSENSRGE